MPCACCLRRGRHRILDPLARHEARDRAPDERRLHRALAQPGVRRGGEQQLAGDGHDFTGERTEHTERCRSLVAVRPTHHRAELRRSVPFRVGVLDRHSSPRTRPPSTCTDARDVRRGIRQQECGRLPELVGFAVAAQRNRRRGAAALFVWGNAGLLGVDRVDLPHAVGADSARNQLVDADALTGQLERERLRERGHRGAQDVRERDVRNRFLDRRRGAHQDGAAAARLHRRHDQTHLPDDAEHQQLERRLPRGVGEIQDAAGGRPAAVREQQIDAAEALHRRLMPPRDVVGETRGRRRSPARGPPDSCSICVPAASIASRLREAIDTCAPSAASARATASPRPLLAPPTIATFPLSFRSTKEWNWSRVRTGSLLGSVDGVDGVIRYWRMRPAPTYCLSSILTGPRVMKAG